MKKQQGFAALGLILVVVVLAIIGGAGYFVWHSRQATDKTLSNTNNSGTKQQSTGYLLLKEWGVKISGTASLNNVTLGDYESPGLVDNPGYAYYRLLLRQPLTGCSSTTVGTITRYLAKTKVTQEYGYLESDDIGKTWQQAISSNFSDTVTAGDYVYVFEGVHEGCGDPNTAAGVAANTQNERLSNDFKASFKALAEIK